MGAPLSLKSVPEGGWRAWITVLASFMVHFLQNGFRDSFGLLVPSIRKSFQVGHAQAATTNSIMMFLILSSSPIAACMIKKVGHRVTMGIGVGISALGLLPAGVHIDKCAYIGSLLDCRWNDWPWVWSDLPSLNRHPQAVFPMQAWVGKRDK